MNLTRWDFLDSKTIKGQGWRVVTAQTCREGRSDLASKNQVVLATKQTLDNWAPKALALHKLTSYPSKDEECYIKSRLVYEIACKSRHHYKRDAALRVQGLK